MLGVKIRQKGDRDAPKYLYMVESKHEDKNLQSVGHAKYLSKFGIKIDLKKPYGTEEIETQEYNTGKRPKEDD